MKEAAGAGRAWHMHSQPHLCIHRRVELVQQLCDCAPSGGAATVGGKPLPQLSPKKLGP